MRVKEEYKLVIVSIFIGIVIGWILPLKTAEADGYSEPENRQARALEEISDSLKKIEKNCR